MIIFSESVEELYFGVQKKQTVIVEECSVTLSEGSSAPLFLVMIADEPMSGFPRNIVSAHKERDRAMASSKWLLRATFFDRQKECQRGIYLL